MAPMLKRCICTAFGICCLFYISVTAQEETIKLYHPEVFGSAGRGPVEFTHGKHMSEYDCVRCHHRFKDGENVVNLNELYAGNNEIQCKSCHFKKASELNLEEAFHSQCMGCHREARRSGKKNAPILCAQCHPKKRQKEK